jgi:hypothetical protein
MIVSVDDDSRFSQLTGKSIIASDMLCVTMRNLDGGFRFPKTFRPSHREDFRAIA